MLSNLDQGWFLTALAAIAIIAFLLGLLVDAILRDDGFGPIGNGVIIGAGFYAGVVVAGRLGFSMSDLAMEAAAGLTGALAAMTALGLARAGLNRLLGG